jgi:beta-lactamase regulating signal transducer with metallopeptidase domain
MDDEQTRFALRHELMHYRRGDHIVSMVLSLLNAVYWFNPFVWMAFRQMREDMETACDSKVVKKLDSAAKSRYASLILSLSAKPLHRQLILGMSRSDAKKAAERRVKCIFMNAKSKFFL